MKKTFVLRYVFVALFFIPTSVFAQFVNFKGTTNEIIHSDRILKIALYDKETDSSIKLDQVQATIHVYDKDKKTTLVSNNNKRIARYMYKDYVQDTMVVEVDVPGYRGGKFMYYKARHRKYGWQMNLYLYPNDYCPNEILVDGDSVRVVVDKQTRVYDVKKLRQPGDEDIVAALCRVPGLVVKKNAITVDGEPLKHFLLSDHEYYSVNWEHQYQEVLSRFRKYKKK